VRPVIYKIAPAALWREAEAHGAFRGSSVDLADGFIHFSTAAQAVETGRKSFAGVAELVALAFEAETLGAGLTWEPSRGGDLFPHLYGPLPTALAIEATPVDLDEQGVPILTGLKG